ncbi:MAG: hypothetical protein WBM24_03500 [Candidatus Sulfotelmatobacter sp.]
MTSTELEKLVRNELTNAGLWGLVDRHKSQFLEFPDGLFAEIVFSDGSNLEDAEGILRAVRESLKKRGVELDVIVRANWTIQDIAEPGPARGLSGGIRAAWAFPVTLISGKLAAEVEVDVTMLAIQEIKSRLVEASEKSAEEKKIMKEVVREFLKLELSLGGESYWDPIRCPQRELNESALLYLLLHSPVGKK